MGAFGAQQSVLESVLLKRRIMGPSWISLHCPTRVDSSKQASSCSHACTSSAAGNDRVSAARHTLLKVSVRHD